MSNMSKSQILLAGSVGGLIVIVWLWLTGDLNLNLGALIALTLSLVIGGGLVWLTVWLVTKSFRKGFANVNFGYFLGSVVAGVLSFLTIMFVLNEGIGAGYRASSMWSFLPEGNLLTAGGPLGWTVLILVSLVVLTPLWKRLTQRNKEPREAKPPRAPREAKERRMKRSGMRFGGKKPKGNVGDGNGADVLESMFGDQKTSTSTV